MKRKSVSREACRSPAIGAALRAAGLLRGGATAARVWRMIGSEPGASLELVRIAAALQRGETIAAALCAEDGEEWRVLATAWCIAEESGAPLAAVLERLAIALSSLERLAERRSVLLAGPRATIRLVSALPFVALLLATALGFDPIATMFHPAGISTVLIGCVLLLMGMRWARLLAARLASEEWVAGLECELLWVALAGGAAPAIALRRVADALDRFAPRWVKFSALGRNAGAQVVMRAAAALGTALGPMLLAEAEAARARSYAELERAAERLAVRVLMPIGVCVLPAFILLGVIPVLLAVLGSLEPVM